MSDVSHDARTGTVIARLPTSTADQVRERRRPRGRGGSGCRGRHSRRAPALAGRGSRRPRGPAGGRRAGADRRPRDRARRGPADQRTRPVCRPAALLRRRRSGGVVPPGDRRSRQGQHPGPAPDAGAARPGRRARREQLPLRLRSPGQRHRLGARRRVPGGREGASGPPGDQRSSSRRSPPPRSRPPVPPRARSGWSRASRRARPWCAPPRSAAVAFTGSQHGGLALWRLAIQRDVVIPVYAEMGTVNPVVMTTGVHGPDRRDRRRVRRLLHPRHRPVLHQARAPPRSRRVRRPGPCRGRPAQRAADRVAAHRGHRRRLRHWSRRAGRRRGRRARPGTRSGRGLVRGRHRAGRVRHGPEAGFTTPRRVLRPGRVGGRVRRSRRAHARRWARFRVRWPRA